MFRGKRVFVVIPAFNEARHIRGVVEEIPPWIDQVIVVDDGSTDGTSERLTDARCVPLVIRHVRNRGVGAAIVSGYQMALREGADVIAVMAGDGQMAATELLSIVEPVSCGRADYAKGDRTTHPLVSQRMPSWRRVGNAALSRWTGLLTGYALRDAQCGFTAITAETLRRLPLERLTRGYGYPNTLLLMLAEQGALVHEVTVTPIYRGERSGLTPILAVKTHGRLLSLATLAALRRGGERRPAFSRELS